MIADLLYSVGARIQSLGDGPARLVNRLMIDRSVGMTRNRPHPWSTEYDYIGWSGLTDRTFNARHLPAADFADLPDAAEVAELFRAPATGQRTCAKSTCLFPAFAQYLTDGFIRTLVTNDLRTGVTREDRRKTTSNHEIDLSPLYGRTREQTLLLRTCSEVPGRRGRLKSQSIGGEEYSPFLFQPGTRTPVADFADADGNLLLDTPLGIDHATQAGLDTLFAVGGDRVNAAPHVAMINTLLLREHNRLAGKIEAAHPGWDDERVFQTARNVVIVLFIKIVVEEYINHINPTPLRFFADPSVAWHAKWNRPNWITAEFSLLYRWHSLMPATMTWKGEARDSALLRLDNRVLLAGTLADALVDVSSNTATALGLENSAPFLVPIELSAIDQARRNRLDGYNAYRRAFGLEPARDFDGFAVSDAVRDRLKRWYGSPDRLEFYVGLFAEPVQTNGPLPELIQTMVAVDAFSQALTNPLLSEHVWGDRTNRRLAFTDLGLAAIEATASLADLARRNCPGLGGRFVGMTRRDWRRS